MSKLVLRKTKKNNSQQGFTLIELLTVVAIFGLLTIIILGTLNNARKEARDVNKLAGQQQLQKAAYMYYLDNGKWPLSSYPNKLLLTGTTIYTVAAYNNNLGYGSPGFAQWSDFLNEIRPYADNSSSIFQLTNSIYDYGYTIYTDASGNPLTAYLQYLNPNSCNWNTAGLGQPLQAVFRVRLEKRAPVGTGEAQVCLGGTIAQVIGVVP